MLTPFPECLAFSARHKLEQYRTEAALSRIVRAAANTPLLTRPKLLLLFTLPPEWTRTPKPCTEDQEVQP
jgi:hypothetical protein